MNAARSHRARRPDPAAGRPTPNGRPSDGATPGDPQLDQIERLAHLLDTRWQVPGTNWRFGIDGLAGLLPGVGDTATGLVSIYLIWQAKRMGVPPGLLLRMAGNVGLDVVLGSVPVLGSIFDFAFKANRRNLRLLRRHLDRHRTHKMPHS